MAREGFSSCAVTTPPAKDTAGILREAMKLPAKNEKFMLQVFFLILAPFSFVVLLHYLVAGPLMQKVEDTYESSSLDPKDLTALIGIEIPFLLMFCVVSLFGMSVSIYSSALTYIGKSTTIKELMLWILSIWKKPIITWLHGLILTIAYIILSLISLQLAALIGTADASYLCSWLVGILASSFYLYLASVLIMGLVISVVEDDSWGAKALGKARRLIQGRRLQGFFLVLILALLSIPIYVLFYVTTTDDDDKLRPAIRFAFMLVATVLFCLSNLFTFVVFTVFHFECKRSHGELLETEFGPGYSFVSSVVLHPDA